MPVFEKPTTLKIDTPLGRQNDLDDEGPLLLSSVQGIEGVSMPYAYDLVLYGKLDKPEVDPRKLINKPATIHMRGHTDSYTARRGIIQTFEKDGTNEETFSRGKKEKYRLYRARMVPAFRRLDAEVKYRVFEGMTIFSILREVFNGMGGGLDFSSYVVPINFKADTFDVIPYCVQYGESSMNFVSRLMSTYAMWYWFEHGQSEQMSLAAHERMMLGIDPGAPTGCEQPDMTVTWDALAPGDVANITGFQRTYVPARNFVFVTDYNMLDPTDPPSGGAPLKGDYDLLPNNNDPVFEREVFPAQGRPPGKDDTTGKWKTARQDMVDQANDRMQDEEGNVFGAQGQSKNPTFVAGRTFQVVRDEADPPDDGAKPAVGAPAKGRYLITQMSFSAFENTYGHRSYWDVLNWFDTPVRWIASWFDNKNKEQYLTFDATASLASAGLSNWAQNVNVTNTTKNQIPQGWPTDNPYQSNFFDTLVSGVSTGLLQGIIQSWVVNGPKDVIEAHRDGYTNAFVAVPWDGATFNIVPGPDGTKPRIYGPQLAVVIGPDGKKTVADGATSDIYADKKLGRVRVRFPWQRIVPDLLPTDAPLDPMKTDRRTCWVPVSEGWAGQGYGTQWFPRIGQDVIVSFLDGDPDRPIITGRYYSASGGKSGMAFPPGQGPAPSVAPSDWTKPQPSTDIRFNGIKTSSTPNTQKGLERYQLVRFDDTYNCEQYLLRAQGRLDVTAFAHSFETTHGNKNVTVVKGKDKDGKPFGGNMYTTVGGEYDLHVGTNRYEQVDKDYELTVKGDVRADLKGGLTAVVKGDVSIGLNSLTVEATEKITLKVGSSFIVIDHCEIYISAPSMVYINSGGSADSAASVTMQNVADAALAEPGDEPNTRLTPCTSQGGGHGSRGTHTEPTTPAPACDTVIDGLSCGFL